VRVNGEVVRSMGVKVDVARDAVSFDGKPVALEQPLYVLLNKPAGYVTTMADPQGRPTVADLVVDLPQRLFPVGRLDLDTEGALLMTNDGELGNFILHPRYNVNKTYEALVRGEPSPDQLRSLQRGVELDGARTSPAVVRVLERRKDHTLLEIVIHEGKKRQVRRMFQAVNHRVVHLRRTAYGRLQLGALAPGTYRVLSPNDLKKIFPGKIPFTIKKILD
jgi:23S rRNA pseudouridine2605 synthase